MLALSKNSRTLDLVHWSQLTVSDQGGAEVAILSMGLSSFSFEYVGNNPNVTLVGQHFSVDYKDDRCETIGDVFFSTHIVEVAPHALLNGTVGHGSLKDACRKCNGSIASAAGTVVFALVTGILSINAQRARTSKDRDSPKRKTLGVLTGLLSSVSAISSLGLFATECIESFQNVPHFETKVGHAYILVMCAAFFKAVVFVAHLLVPAGKVDPTEWPVEKSPSSPASNSGAKKWLRFVHIAGENGNESIVVECLLCYLREVRKRGKLVDVVSTILDRHRRTVLHSACIGLQADVVRLLLGHTVQVCFFGWSERNDELKAILAICEENGGVVTNMDAFSSDPRYDIRLPPSLTFQPHHFGNGNMADSFGNTPLLCTSSTALDLDFSKMDKSASTTPLSKNPSKSDAVDVKLSVKAGILKLLLDVGDSPFQQNYLTGWNPLHWAAYYGDVESCCILLGSIDQDFFAPPGSTKCTAFVHDRHDSRACPVTKGIYTAHKNVVGKWLRLRVDLKEDDLEDVEQWSEGVILDYRLPTTGSMMEHLVGFRHGSGSRSRQGWYCLAYKRLAWVTKSDGTCPLLHPRRRKVDNELQQYLRRSQEIPSGKKMLPLDIACLETITKGFNFAPPSWNRERGARHERKRRLLELQPDQTTPWKQTLNEIHIEVAMWRHAGHWPRNGQGPVYVALWLLEDATCAFRSNHSGPEVAVEDASNAKVRRDDEAWWNYRDHALYWACFFGIQSQVQDLADTSGVNFLCKCTGPDDKIQTPLHAAAGRNNTDVVRYICRHLRRVQQHQESMGDDGAGVASIALSSNRTDAESMLEGDWLIRSPGWFNSNNETPLHTAALHDAFETITYLMAVIPLASWQRFDDDGWLVSDLCTSYIAPPPPPQATSIEREQEGGMLIRNDGSDTRKVRAPHLVSMRGKQNTVSHLNLALQVNQKQCDDVATTTTEVSLVLTFKRDEVGFQTYRVMYETLVEGSNEAPPLKVLKSEAARFNACTKKDGDKIDYLLVGISDKNLWHEAEEIGLRKKLRGRREWQPFSKKSKHLFDPFTSGDKQRVVMNVIMRQANIEKYIKDGLMQQCFALHSLFGRANVLRHWARFREAGGEKKVQMVVPPIWPLPGRFRSYFKQDVNAMGHRTMDYKYYLGPLTILRKYCGPKFALYYAWYEFYTSWLFLMAVVGIFVFIANGIFFGFGTPFGTLEGGSTRKKQAFTVFIFCYFLFGIVWASLLAEKWKSKRNEILFWWDLRNSLDTQVERPEFEGETVVSDITNRLEKSYPSNTRLTRYIRGWTLLVMLVAVLISVFAGSRIAATSDVDNVQFKIGGINVDIQWHKLFASAFNAAFITFMNIAYAKVGEFLTQWENHRTVSQFETHLAVKTIFFQVINSYVAIIYLTFAGNRNELRLQLFSLLTVKPFIENFMEFVVPEVMVYLCLPCLL
jgi:ankyrin repeat protein